MIAPETVSSGSNSGYLGLYTTEYITEDDMTETDSVSSKALVSECQ